MTLGARCCGKSSNVCMSKGRWERYWGMCGYVRDGGVPEGPEL